MNLEYELKYWKNNGIKKGEEHQRKYCLAYLKFFEGMVKHPLQILFREATCAEVGPGPFGGMSLVFFPRQWIFIDPLNSEYRSLVPQDKKNIFYMNAKVEQIESLNNSIDAVFCTNALDHTENRQLAERKIFRMLKKGAFFFLAVHCRTRDELNEGHTQDFTGMELIKELEKSGFKTVNYTMINDRFIPEQTKVYNTLVGVFAK